jgi:hypothetical protein
METARPEMLFSYEINHNTSHRNLKNEGSVGIKQRPAKMDGRTTYWTLPPKRTPFQNGVDR